MAEITIDGGATGGYCAIGSWVMATEPSTMMKSAITQAKIGRSIKNLAMAVGLISEPLTRRHWLMRQLAAEQGKTVEPGKDPLFDEALVRQVKQYQLAQGLIPDGAVGAQTLMRLAGIADPSAPRLMPGNGGK